MSTCKSLTAMLLVLSVLLLVDHVSGSSLQRDNDDILSTCDEHSLLKGSTSARRNCRCDELCPLYADCCLDYLQPEPAANSLRDVIRCEVMRKTVGVEGIYVISLCPRHYTGGDDVKQACEKDMFDDVIHRLPVSGGDSSLVYRNIYCAACHDEPHPSFWLVSMTHCEGALNDSQCQLAFHAGNDSQTVPRSCLQDVNRCVDEWNNATLAAMCRHAAASYVTDGRRVFRNRHCAVCNNVDDTQLQPIQLPSLSSVMSLDLNESQPVDVGRLGLCDAGQLYDRLLSRCVVLPYCASSWSHCRHDNAQRVARDASVDCPAGLIGINSSDYIRYDNGSVFVLSLRTLFDSDSCRYDNQTVYVCLRHQPVTFTVSLFALNDVQRLVSVVTTVIGLLALTVLLMSYCCLVGCRRDNSRKMAVCFVVCMLLYHVIYVVVLVGTRLPFIATNHQQVASLIVCAGMQYFAMAAFFWLHVLSIEAFRAVRHWCNTDTPFVTSCTALFVYSLYAWCVPALIVGWSTALPLLRIAGWQLMGEVETCCVLGLLQLVLFVVPVVVSLLIDVVLYVLTALLLCQHTAHQYETDTLLPDRHSPRVDTQWTTRTWSAERLRAERRAAEAVSQRWNDVYVTCIQTSLLLAGTWTLCLLPVTGSIDWPAVLWYVYMLIDLALMVTVCLSWCSVERVWYILSTRKRDRCSDDKARPTDRLPPSPVAGPRGKVAGSTGRRTPPAFNDAASLRLFMRETSI